MRGNALVVTGPAKGEELHRLAILHGSLLVVDALDELERVIALAAGLGQARILLRCLPHEGAASRFGMDEAELHVALERCAQARDAVRMEGFSFHLSGYEVAPRADLAGRLLRLVRAGTGAGAAGRRDQHRRRLRRRLRRRGGVGALP